MPTVKGLILQLLDGHRVMTIATNRTDGWPQATMVGYLNDGFLLYCFVARNAQKYANIRRDPRVSITIGFGRSDLVTFSERDLDVHIDSLRHRWDGNSVTDRSMADVRSRLGRAP
jgi:hypothetical protein